MRSIYFKFSHTKEIIEVKLQLLQCSHINLYQICFLGHLPKAVLTSDQLFQKYNSQVSCFPLEETYEGTKMTYVVDGKTSQHVGQASDVVELDVPNVDHTFNCIDLDLNETNVKY